MPGQGIRQQIFQQPQIQVKNGGTVRYRHLRVVENQDGKFVVLNKDGYAIIVDDDGREAERYSLEIGALLNFKDEAKIKKNQILATWDPYNVSIHSEQRGIVEFHDIVEGSTMKKELDETTGLSRIVITEHREDLHPQVVVLESKGGDPLGYYSIPTNAHIVVKQRHKIGPGALLAKMPRMISKVKDITGGLPRVAELFEARKPKDAAEIAKIDGVVEFKGTHRGRRRIVVSDEKSGMAEEHEIPLGKHITVYNGAYVKKGQQLTEGPVIPHEILEVCGPRELQQYLVDEVQQVYRLQGVEINDKHFEIIIRQMLKSVSITEPGDTDFLYGQHVNKTEFAEANRLAMADGKKPAEAAPLFLGITKSSLETDSFISAASFQDTTRVLTDAACTGRTDRLKGFKENVIMGHMIPAGTGFPAYRRMKLEAEEAAEDEELKEDISG